MRLIRGLGLLAVNISSCAILVYDMMSIFCAYMFYGILWWCCIKKTPPGGEELLSQDGYGWKNLLYYNSLSRLFSAFGVDDFQGVETFFEVVDAGIGG
jgi:hypothetical protein